MRQKACEQINDMFGLNVWVEFEEDTRVADDYVFENKKEGENNE